MEMCVQLLISDVALVERDEVDADATGVGEREGNLGGVDPIQVKANQEIFAVVNHD